MLAGVAGGTAKYLGVDPTFVRLGFAAAALFGLGLGVLAYLVMAVVVPRGRRQRQARIDGRPPIWAIVLLAHRRPGHSSRPVLRVGRRLLVVRLRRLLAAGPGRGRRAGLPGLARRVARPETAAPQRRPRPAANPSRAARGRPSPRPPRARRPPPRFEPPRRRDGAEDRAVARDRPARVLRLLPGGLDRRGRGVRRRDGQRRDRRRGRGRARASAWPATALVGDAFRRTAPWLLGLALLLALPAGAVAAADVRFDGGIGEQTYAPVTAAEIPDDGYELGRRPAQDRPAPARRRARRDRGAAGQAGPRAR